jgi:membrane-associated phospholipid phosphatase
VFAATATVVTPAYLVVVRLNSWRGLTSWNPSFSLDYLIPVIPWSVVCYLSFYLWFPAASIMTPRTDEARAELLVLHQALIVVDVFSITVFIACPCDIRVIDQLPEQLRLAEGWPGALYGALHSLDRPFNAWPCLHISLSLLIACYLARRFARTRWIATVWTAWSLMAASTLTTKQHYLFDVLTGALVALVAWRFLVSPGLAHGRRLGPPPSTP